ncbi:MAG: glycosyltransferase [Rhizonema sp. NSF051]|nr:glycosyltransferase [Rhizonema sp. NSF051]
MMTGKRIVITTFGSLGDLHPAIALGLGLKARGHHVSIAVNEFYRRKIEPEGLEFYPIPPERENRDPALIERILDPKIGAQTVICELVLSFVRETYSNLMQATQDADLLISSDFVFAAPLLAEKTGIPWVSYLLSPSSFFSLYDPPRLSGFANLPQLPVLERALNRAVLQLARLSTARWLQPIRQLRQELGLPPGNHPLFEDKYSPHLVLGIFSSVLGKPQPDWVSQAQITGFAFYDRLVPEQKLSAELADFLGSGSPPVVFTLGSAVVRRAGNSYTESLKAVKVLGCRAVFLVGVEEFENELPPLPDGTIAVDYAPFSELFPRAAAIVHQGGVGTTAQALRAGVPMLIVPYAFDQPDNAARVVRLGIALQIPRESYRCDRAVTALHQLLSNPTYKTIAQSVKERVDAEDGVQSACDAIERTFFKLM